METLKPNRDYSIQEGKIGEQTVSTLLYVLPYHIHRRSICYSQFLELELTETLIIFSSETSLKLPNLHQKSCGK